MKIYNPFYYRFLKGVLWTYLNYFLDLEFWEEEALPPGPKVMVVNHPTVFDAFPLLIHRGRGFVHVTVEDQIWSYTAPRIVFTLSNQIKLDMAPGKGRGAMNDALQLLALPNSHAVLFSIEGGQTLPERRSEVRARRGAILLAMEAGCPIIPVGVHVPARNIRRKVFNYFYKGKEYSDVSYVPRFRSAYGVLIGKAMHPQEELNRESSHEDYQAYADKVLAEVYRLADGARDRMRRK